MKQSHSREQSIVLQVVLDDTLRHVLRCGVAVTLKGCQDWETPVDTP